MKSSAATGQLIPKSEARKSAWLCAATLVWAGLMAMVPGITFSGVSSFDHGKVKSRILTVELGTGRFVSEAVPNPEIARVVEINTGMDFVFILLYCSMFLSFADRARQLGSRVSALLGTAALGAAGFDVLENCGIFSEMQYRTSSGAARMGELLDRSAAYTSTVSRCKWYVLALALLLSAVVFWRISSVSSATVYKLGFRATALLSAAAAVLCGYGLFSTAYHFLNVAFLFLLGPAIVLSAILLGRMGQDRTGAMSSEHSGEREQDIAGNAVPVAHAPYPSPSGVVLPCDPDSETSRTAYSFREVFAHELRVVKASRALRLSAPAEKRQWSPQLLAYSAGVRSRQDASVRAAADLSIEAPSAPETKSAKGAAHA